MKVGALIVAAGSSNRMGQTNKLLIKIGDKEVIATTLINFNNTSSISYIIVVTKPDMFDIINNIKHRYNLEKIISVVEGGETRQQSVGKGLLICPEDTDMIAIHDGARPFADSELITKVVNDCTKYGGALPSVPVKETIKEIKDGFIGNTPDRSKLYVAQTPQVFNFKDYKYAFDEAKKNNLDFTDDCQLFEYTGKKVYISTGSYKNIKITTPEDVILAKAFMEA